MSDGTRQPPCEAPNSDDALERMLLHEVAEWQGEIEAALEKVFVLVCSEASGLEMGSHRVRSDDKMLTTAMAGLSRLRQVIEDMQHFPRQREISRTRLQQEYAAGILPTKAPTPRQLPEDEAEDSRERPTLTVLPGAQDGDADDGGAGHGQVGTGGVEPEAADLEGEVAAFLDWGRRVRGWADETCRHYGIYTRRLLLWAMTVEERPLLEMSRGDLRRFLDSLTDSPHVRNAALKAARAWFDRLVDREQRDDNPADHVETAAPPQALPKTLTGEQGAALAETADQAGGWPQAALLLMLYAGLRISEVRLLRWDHVDLADGWVTVKGKGSKERCLPLHERLAAALRDARQQADELGSGYVCANQHHPASPLCDTRVRDEITHLAEAAGIDGFTPHMARHTYATQLLEATGDLALVQDALGHSSPHTTRVYAQVRNGRLSDAIRGLAY
jgi:site-specific recombinase XerD